MCVKYDDVPCDGYTYHGRSSSMRRVITGDLAVERPHDKVDRTDHEQFAPARSISRAGL